jgi:hypothetical protein
MKIIAIVCILMTQACLVSAQEIVGSWGVNWDATINQTSTADLQRYNQSEEMVKTRTRKGIETRKYIFLASGEVHLKWMGATGERSSTGLWSFDDTTKILTMAIQGDSKRYTVDFLNQQKLLLEMEDKPENLLFPKVVLMKIEN